MSPGGYAAGVTLDGRAPITTPSDRSPSIVGLIAGGVLDAELAALVWLLVEGRVPLVAAVPSGREGAGLELVRGILASIRADDAALGIEVGLDRAAAWELVHGSRPGAVLEAPSLEVLRN